MTARTGKSEAMRATIGSLQLKGAMITIFDPKQTVVDLVTAEEPGMHCDHCCDPIDRGDLVAVLSNGERVHDDGCKPDTDTNLRPDRRV